MEEQAMAKVTATAKTKVTATAKTKATATTKTEAKCGGPSAAPLTIKP